MCEALKNKPASVFETEKKRGKKNQLFCQTMQVQTAVSRIEREEEVKSGVSAGLDMKKEEEEEEKKGA